MLPFTAQADPTTLDYITLALAIVGAVTGIAALAAQFASLLVSGWRVKVTATHALSTGDERWYVSANVSNVGRQAVTITGLDVLLSGDRKVPLAMGFDRWVIGPSLPHRLDSGSEATWLFAAEAIMDAVISAKASPVAPVSVALATGKRVKSNTIDFAKAVTLNR